MDELAACKAAWLDTQISALDPPLILLLGAVALGCVLGPLGKMKDLHGSMHSYRDRPVLITYHPSAALRFPWARRAMQQDLAQLSEMLSFDRVDRASGRE
jgi:DNA polymerase